MNAHRKYVDEQELHVLLSQTPSWGVDILTIGHNLHPANKAYPDHNYPNQYCFDWSEGRIMGKF